MARPKLYEQRAKPVKGRPAGYDMLHQFEHGPAIASSEHCAAHDGDPALIMRLSSILPYRAAEVEAELVKKAQADFVHHQAFKVITEVLVPACCIAETTMPW